MDTDVLVLDTIDHGESDVIVTLFTRESGRLAAIAKGAKKSKKRFVNKLELFTFLHIGYEQRSNSTLGFLKEAEIHTSFPNIRQFPELYSISSIIREFLLLSIKEGEQEQELFRLSLWSLHQLNQFQPARSTLALFLIRYLSELGYRPDLHSCGNCQSPFEPDRQYRFMPNSGRLICSNCTQHEGSGISVANGTIKVLQAAQTIPLERLHRVRISGAALVESLKLLHNFSVQILQRDIISWKELNKYAPTTRSEKK